MNLFFLKTITFSGITSLQGHDVGGLFKEKLDELITHVFMAYGLPMPGLSNLIQATF